MMTRILVWDLPTRVLHWVLAGSLLVALILGFGVDDEHPLFPYHMLSGLVAGFALLLRIAWGLVGSRQARFSSWPWSPVELARYLLGVFTGRAPRHVAHNPANSWFAVALFGTAALLIATGLAAGKRLAEAHEVLAAMLIAIVSAHLLGLAWHTLRHRENIARAMIDGRKEGPDNVPPASRHRFAGIVILLLSLVWAGALIRNYAADTRRVRLPLAGIELRLGEGEDHEPRRPRHRHEREHSDE